MTLDDIVDLKNSMPPELMAKLDEWFLRAYVSRIWNDADAMHLLLNIIKPHIQAGVAERNISLQEEWLSDNLSRIEGLTAASGRTDLKDILVEMQNQIIALKNIVLDLMEDAKR